jgi:uncharacterized protein YjbI with pentapeptide repeats
MSSPAIQNQQHYDNATFKRLDHTDAVFQDVTFSACAFVRCNFSRAVFQNCRFVDCTLENCILRMTEVPGTTFARVSFKACDLPGVDWSEANWSGWTTKTGSLHFDDCNLQYSIFFGLELVDLHMTDCNAREANFAEASLVKADFSGTDFSGAIFLRTDLTEASFVNATGYTLSLSDNTTDGTKFSLPEAVRLLHSLDIKLVDPATEDEIDPDALNNFL